MIEYETVARPVKEIPKVIELGFTNDVEELKASLKAAAKLGFALSNPIAGAQALIGLFQARGRALQAYARIEEVVGGWLGRSADSQKRLKASAAEWRQLQSRGESLAADMRELLARGRSNEWQGAARDNSVAQQEKYVTRFEGFVEDVQAVPKSVDNAAGLTTLIFMLVTAPQLQGQLTAQTMAGRVPVPNPSMFGLCTRTPFVAASYEGVASTLEAVKNGGLWRILEKFSAAGLEAAGTGMRNPGDA